MLVLISSGYILNQVSYLSFNLKGHQHMSSLNSLIKNSGKIIKKTLKVARAIKPAEQSKRLADASAIFHNNHLV